MARRLLGLSVLIALFLLPGTAAMAHPLGNFTINAFSDVQVSRDEVVVDYALDLAEIPTLQLLDELDTSSTGREMAVSDLLAPQIRDGLLLAVDGEPVGLEIDEASARFAPGQGSLATLRVDVRLTGELPSEEGDLVFEDANYDSRIGWREVVLRPFGGQGLQDPSVPPDSISEGLNNYPSDLLSDPPRVTSATAVLLPGAGSAAAPRDDVKASEPQPLLGVSFESLVDDELTFGVILGAIFLAMGFGAVHALGPGHGKTVMAAYLIGAGGKPRHALVVGIAVSLMHTTSVVLLGVITLWASDVLSPETVYPYISLASGLVVVGLGSWLLRTRVQARRRRANVAVSHGHKHDLDNSHDHDHPHDHDHDHARAHALGLDHSHGELPPGVSVTSWRGLGVIAISGGLLPSPSALVVLLAAVTLDRVAFGVVLVTAFSIGLAAALTVVGLLVLKARDVAEVRMQGRWGRLLPVLSATTVLVLGLVLTVQALTTLPLWS